MEIVVPAGAGDLVARIGSDVAAGDLELDVFRDEEHGRPLEL